MSEEYTPTLNEVREAYVVGVDPAVTSRYRAEFDRFIAAHDAEKDALIEAAFADKDAFHLAHAKELLARLAEKDAEIARLNALMDVSVKAAEWTGRERLAAAEATIAEALASLDRATTLTEVENILAAYPGTAQPTGSALGQFAALGGFSALGTAQHEEEDE